MNTTRNRSKVMAIALRAAVKEIRRTTASIGFEGDAERRKNALESIDAVAEELEAIADPRPKCCSGLGRGRGRCPKMATTRYRRVLADGSKVCYARCDDHPLSARVGDYSAERIAPDPDGGQR